MIKPVDLRNPVEMYFHGFLSDKRDRELLPGLRNLSARFAIDVHGASSGIWTLQMDRGMLRTVEVGLLDPQCHYRLKDETFLQIAAGLLSPQYAFFQRRIEIQGRIDVGLRVANVLAGFFKQFPYAPVEIER